MQLPDIRNVEVKGKRVLVRADINSPLAGGSVRDDFRLRQVSETLLFLRERGARIIVASHLGGEGESLRPVAEAMHAFCPLSFLPHVIGERVEEAVENLGEGDVLLLENLRTNPGEEANDPQFAKALAALADLYVNEAFSASHRSHASLVLVPTLLPAYAGIVFQEEVAELEKALTPRSPSLFVLGGAKFETKLPLITKFLNVYDSLFVGGALANDLLRAKGYEVGDSLVSDVSPEVLFSLLRNEHLLLPTDVVVVDREGSQKVVPVEGVSPGDVIKDVGPQTMRELARRCGSVEFILWNGPLGNYEEGFAKASAELAHAIADSRAYSLVGGGDTVAVITEAGRKNDFSFLSTGGGAMLVFLENGTLPGIEALRGGNS